MCSRRERWLLPAAGLFTVLGIAVLLLPTAPPRSYVLVDVGGKSIPVYGASERQVAIIKESFHFLPQSVKKSVKSLNILDRFESYDHFENAANIGDCHYDGEICVRGDSLDHRLIWYETGHAYAFALPDKFRKEWLEADGGFNYGTYPDDVRFPKDGILTNYGSVSWQEDAAEWVAEIYCYISQLEHDAFCRVCRNKNSINMSDPRYLQKLDLLLKWGFISKEDYNHIRPLLQ